ncbi:MAG: hypothetical protein ACTSXF_13905 [Promethearchaeota archaeon]
MIKYLLERLGVDINKIDIRLQSFKNEKNNFSGIIYIKWDISKNKEDPFIELKINEHFLTKVLEHLYNDYTINMRLGNLPNECWTNTNNKLRTNLEYAILEALAKHETSHILSLPYSKIPEELLSDKILLNIMQMNNEYFPNDYRHKVKMNYILVRFIRVFKEVIAESANLQNFGIDPYYLLYLEELIDICIKDLKKMHIIFVDPLKEILFLILQDLSYIFMADDLVQNQIDMINGPALNLAEKLNRVKSIIERIKTKIKLLLKLSSETSLRSSSYRGEMLYSRIIEVFKSFKKIIKKFELGSPNKKEYLDGNYTQIQGNDNQNDINVLNNLKKMYIQVFKIAIDNADLFL